MPENFVFPPPPPPPPRASAGPPASGSNHSPTANGVTHPRGGFTGKLNRDFDRRGGNVGPRGDRAGQRSSYSYQQRNGFRDRVNQNSPLQSLVRTPNSQARSGAFQSLHSGFSADHVPIPSDHDRGLKRPHQQAFPRNASTGKIQTAPAVPSFGVALPTLPDLTQSSFKPVVSQTRNSTNSLGLVPAADDDTASDADEEVKLAANQTQNDSLSFSYKGKISILKTPEDIASWIAERRRNFPTAARREAMARKKDQSLARAVEARQLAKKRFNDAQQSKHAKKITHDQTKAMSGVANIQKAETLRPAPVPAKSEQEIRITKLRKAMEKNAKKIAKLEAASARIDTHNVIQITGSSGLDTLNPARHDTIDNNAPETDLSVVSSSSEDESTSSSGSSSDEDEDGNSLPDVQSEVSAGLDTDEMEEDQINANSDSEAPQELVSTRSGPIQVAAPNRNKPDTRPVCRNIKKYGKCSRKFCKFRHKSSTGGIISQLRQEGDKPPQKLSLYQRLLKQQIEEDQQAAAADAKTKPAMGKSDTSLLTTAGI